MEHDFGAAPRLRAVAGLGGCLAIPAVALFAFLGVITVAYGAMGGSEALIGFSGVFALAAAATVALVVVGADVATLRRGPWWLAAPMGVGWLLQAAVLATEVRDSKDWMQLAQAGVFIAVFYAVARLVPVVALAVVAPGLSTRLRSDGVRITWEDRLYGLPLRQGALALELAEPRVGWTTAGSVIALAPGLRLAVGDADRARLDPIVAELAAAAAQRRANAQPDDPGARARVAELARATDDLGAGVARRTTPWLVLGGLEVTVGLGMVLLSSGTVLSAVATGFVVATRVIAAVAPRES